MRNETLIVAAVLLCVGAPGTFAANSDQTSARLPHGTEILAPAQRLPREDIETSQPVFVVDRRDLIADQDEPATPVAAPPPPGIDAAGTPAEPDAAEAEELAPDLSEIKENPLPEKIRPSDELAAGVTIRTEGDLTIEEYRRDGQIYMVVVVPKKGPKYTYLDTDGNGRLEGDPNDGPVQPVYYTLYEWE